MSKQNLVTNLVGRKVQITMGSEVNERTRTSVKSSGADRDGRSGWAYFGDEADVVAAVNDGGLVKLTVALSNGKMIEVYATHVRLVEGES